MTFPLQLHLQEFFLLLVFGSMLAIIGVMIPVQIAAKLRRMNRKRTHATCRICGYRFLRVKERGLVRCPHCGVKNK